MDRVFASKRNASKVATNPHAALLGLNGTAGLSVGGSHSFTSGERVHLQRRELEDGASPSTSTSSTQYGAKTAAAALPSRRRASQKTMTELSKEMMRMPASKKGAQESAPEVHAALSRSFSTRNSLVASARDLDELRHGSSSSLPSREDSFQRRRSFLVRPSDDRAGG